MSFVEKFRLRKMDKTSYPKKVYILWFYLFFALVKSENSKRRKLGENGATDESHDQSHEDHMTPPSNGVEVAADISGLFKKELATAKAKLLLSESRRSRPPSVGHRAGFDAFMTGYSFAWYTLNSSINREKQEGEGGEGGRMERVRGLRGLCEMRNCLPSRARNWRVPLHIMRSHFSKTSNTHSSARQRLTDLANTLK